MSKSSSSAKKSKTVAAPPPESIAEDTDIDMTSDVGAEFPSTKIGSYLSQNYNIEVESKKVPGFICGQCYCTNALKARESIRCRVCGYRIMYKERLRRPMEYSAQ